MKKEDAPMRKSKKIALVSIAAVLLALVIACGIYVSDYYRADETALAALITTEQVTVEQRDGMTIFLPSQAETGLLFYPGGKVQAQAYAPLMKALAEQKVLCVLLEMPFHLAVLDMDAAAGVPEQFPQIRDWYIGGHSLGGSMAASYAAKAPKGLNGIVLLAAYSTEDLKETGLKVLSIYGTEDGVLNMEKYQQYRDNLPEGALEYRIEGGNHAGFGSYGSQDGDGEAALAAQEQTAMTASAIVAFFAEE